MNQFNMLWHTNT